MRSILLKEYGKADVMYLGESELPKLKSNEVLVKVEAFAINRADILQRKGKYPSPEGASPLMGLEVAGIVYDTNGSTRWKQGDRVCGLVPGGGYAEYAAVDEKMLIPINEGMTFEQAAAIPEVFLTAFLALNWLGKVQKGENVLIHAAAGGVGTAAIQIAKNMGANVLITASKYKHEVCKLLGASVCIDYKDYFWADEVVNAVGRNNINVVLDFIGGPYFNDNLNVMAMDGRLIMLALMGSGDVDRANLRNIIGKRVSIYGSTLRNRSLDFQRNLCKDFVEFAIPLFEERKLRPVVDSVMDWTEIIQAHKRMEANEHTGKIVMKIS